MLENYVEVKYAFRNHSDLWRKIEMGTLNTNAAVREGTQHMLDVFKKNPNKYDPDKIEGLDLQFEEILDDICKNCRYDVKFKQVDNEQLPLFAEFKSYNTDTWANIKNSNKFIKQFKRYLQEKDITKMDDLAYIINERKANINDVKKAFKELFDKEKEEIFKVMNEKTRESILGQGNANRFDLFKKAIDDHNSKMYSFIENN